MGALVFVAMYMCWLCVCVCTCTAENPTRNSEMSLGGHNLIFPSLPALDQGQLSGSCSTRLPLTWQLSVVTKGVSSKSSPGKMCECVCVCPHRPLSYQSDTGQKEPKGRLRQIP